MENVIKRGTSKFLIVAALVIILAGVMAAKTVILPLISAIFISIICMKPIDWLNAKGVNYSLSVFIVLIVVIAVFSSLGGVIGNSFTEFMKDLPIYQKALDAKLASTLGKLDRFDDTINTKQLLSLIDPEKFFSFTTGALSEIGKFLSDFFVILIITIFMLLEAKGFGYKVKRLNELGEHNFMSFTKIGDEIRNYLFIKTLISIATGIFIWIWLLIVGVDYAILWGVIAFLLNYIPNIGSIIAAVPTMLLALVQLGWGGFMWTGVGYLLVNTIMGNFIEPKMMGKGLGLSTLVVFMSLIVWGAMFGSIGMFLSVPLTITLKIVLEQNPRTQWIAVLLGSNDECADEDQESMVKKHTSKFIEKSVEKFSKKRGKSKKKNKETPQD